VSVSGGSGFCVLARTWVLYRDIILSNNSHPSSLIAFHVATGSTVFAAISICCRMGLMDFS
jgi:hypothetical protein